jgi:hypothetical protein
MQPFGPAGLRTILPAATTVILAAPEPGVRRTVTSDAEERDPARLHVPPPAGSDGEVSLERRNRPEALAGSTNIGLDSRSPPRHRILPPEERKQRLENAVTLEMPQARSTQELTGLVNARSTDCFRTEPRFSQSAETTWPEPEQARPAEPEPERLRQPGPERPQQHQPERSSSGQPAACRQPAHRRPEHSRSERQPEHRQPERSRSERQPERSSLQQPEHSSSGRHCSSDRDGNGPSCNEPS